MSDRWVNRIVGHADVDPESLLANERNWRIHPMEAQQEPLLGVLSEVGVVASVMVNRRSSEEWPAGQRGVETLVDGHLRVLLALRTGQQSIPVDYVDLTPDEEALILATFDPIAGLAVADAPKLAELLAQVQTEDPALQQVLADLAEAAGLTEEEKAKAGRDFGEDPAWEHFVPFKFGEYAGKVSQEVYDSFVKAYKAKQQESGEPMLDDVLRVWLDV